jgi:hypothetical protein
MDPRQPLRWRQGGTQLRAVTRAAPVVNDLRAGFEDEVERCLGDPEWEKPTLPPRRVTDPNRRWR